MANNKNHMKNLKPFKKWKEGWPGRPPKTLTVVLGDLRAKGYEEVKAANVVEAYQILLGLDKDELRKVAKNQKLPAILSIVAMHMLTVRGADMLERMLDRAHGKPKQTIEHGGGIKIDEAVQQKKRNFVKELLWLQTTKD